MGRLIGVYFGNYLTQRGQFLPCQMAWHGSYFKMRDDDPYSIGKLSPYDVDDDELEIPDEGENIEY